MIFFAIKILIGLAVLSSLATAIFFLLCLIPEGDDR
jgi:hypothetical protein